jgi:hypothetical protein
MDRMVEGVRHHTGHACEVEMDDLSSRDSGHRLFRLSRRARLILFRAPYYRAT